jgi:hypothetical protein
MTEGFRLTDCVGSIVLSRGATISVPEKPRKGLKASRFEFLVEDVQLIFAVWQRHLGKISLEDRSSSGKMCRFSLMGGKGSSSSSEKVETGNGHRRRSGLNASVRAAGDLRVPYRRRIAPNKHRESLNSASRPVHFVR